MVLASSFWHDYKDQLTLAVSSSIAVAALLVAWAQARNGRLLDLHEKITTGDLGVARHRLAAHLYEGGSSLAARFVWTDLQKMNTASCPTCHCCVDDFYSMVWFFQRLNRAVRTPILGAVTGLVPFRGAKEMLDWHIVWWSIAFENISSNEARFADDLHRLARRIDPDGSVRREALTRFAAVPS